MTPLSDALTTAQRRALAALEKAYVAGHIEAEDLPKRLASFGVNDPTDVAFLLAALDVLKEWGVPGPTMTERVARENGEPKKATEGQVSYIVDLLKKGQHEPLAVDDLRALPFERASVLIEALKTGSYKADEWDLPF